MKSDGKTLSRYGFLLFRAISAVFLLIPEILYLIIKNDPEACTFFTDRITGPFKRAMASFFSFLPISMAEILIILLFSAAAALPVFLIVTIIRRKSGWKIRIIKVITLVLLIVLFGWSMMDMMWGVNYYSYSFSERSGISSDGCSVDDLSSVTLYFALQLNNISGKVPRDDTGLFIADTDIIAELAPEQIDLLCDRYPFLSGKDIAPRAAILSVVMSFLSTSGYTFPYTGECMLNVHQPDAFIPFTAVHELSHQRNVASEEEANFTAALACLESNHDEFRYSGLLHSFIFLSNSLYSVAPELTNGIYDILEHDVLSDIRANNSYWKRFENNISEKTDEMYDGFLKEYDQPLGIKSYGAVTDLLVTYYKEDAKAFFNEYS